MSESSFLIRWVTWVAAHPRLTLLCLLLVTLFAGFIATDRYAMNSRLGDLIQQEGGWRDDYDDFREAFPQLVETAIVVVSGSRFQQVENRSRVLEALIAEEKNLFVDVYAPANESFFSNNALLYLDIERLDQVADQLAQAQPMLAAVSSDPSLRGALSLLASTSQTSATAGYWRSIEQLDRSAKAALSGRDATVYWRDQFFSSSERHYRLIFLRGKQNFGATLPNAQIVGRLRELIEEAASGPDQLGFDQGDLQVALTGEIALRHDEVEAATSGVKIAGAVALVLLGIVLALGVRSLKIVLATFAVLLVGVVWTSAWAMLSVGSFNTLSLVFLVMFFGLGVDFCVHFSLRVQEACADLSNTKDQGIPNQTLGIATHSVGGAVLLCTLTTAIGFLGFVPTPYKGLADLGVISAGGLVVACFLTFTLLPALFSLFGLPGTKSIGFGVGGQIVSMLQRNRKAVFVLLPVLAVGALLLMPRMQFDYSVLALRDPDAQSMQTLRELQRENQITDYALYTLAPREKLQQQKSLANLDTVERVITPLDYLPSNAEEKMFVLEDLQELLGGSLSIDNSVREPTSAELRLHILNVAAQLETNWIEAPPDERKPIDNFVASLKSMATSDEKVLLAWQSGVIGTLRSEIEWLGRAVEAEEPAFSDLPEGLRSRLVTSDGRFLSAILPANDITPVEELNRFIDSVRRESPEATGRPVIEWGVGNIVLESFQTALVLALSGIAFTLLIVTRSFVDSLLVLTPLLLTAVFTVATSVLFGVAINMASVLVLPLIFGLGVDNGIHMVERYRTQSHGELSFMQSSTPRAVLLSTLTTIGTFAALMLSPHAGTASIGFLLTVAVGYLLVFTVFLLPLLLSLLGSRRDIAAS